jgi:PAS domain S-box-containing protein
MDINLRPSGIDGLGDMSWGNHFCLFYETKEDLLDFLIPFFKAGLEHQEFCLCVASEPLIAEEAEHAMRKAFPDFDRYLTRGQIEITPHTDWYLKDGHFNEQRVLQGWIDKLDQALTKGFSGVRFAANILLEERDWESFAGYEGKLEETLRNLRIEGLCAYNLNRYSAANVLDIMHHHQFTLARRKGKWEPLEGIQLKQAHEEVLKLNAELEQRVMERTMALTSINEQLGVEIAERKQAEEAFSEENQRLNMLLQTAPLAIVAIDSTGLVQTWNPAAERLFGWTADEVLGRLTPIVPEEEQQGFEELLAAELKGEVRNGLEIRRLRKDGSLVDVSLWTAPFHNAQREIVGTIGMFVDITARRSYEATLNSLLNISDHLHRNLETDKLLEALIIEAMKLTDSKLGWVGLPTERGMTLVRHISHGFEVVPFEYSWPPGVGWPGWVLVHKVPYISNDAGSDKVIVPEIRKRFGVKSGIDTPVLNAEGNILGFFEVNNKTNGGGYNKHDVELLMAVSRIASVALQNASSYQNLRRAEESIKSLSRRLMNMQESERRSLTTELHDRVGQNLTALSINLQNMKALLSRKSAKVLTPKFDDAQALVEDITRQIRDIMAELYLPELEDYGLAAALETYAERAASHGNLELIADLPDLDSPPLTSDVRIALFRSAQEAISNVLKHANATQLEISLQGENGRVRLRVEDDGRGFDPNAASQKETPSWGLRIMRERIESIGGNVQIESKPGQGTRVTFEVERQS